jgi:hypothetical protein
MTATHPRASWLMPLADAVCLQHDGRGTTSASENHGDLQQHHALCSCMQHQHKGGCLLATQVCEFIACCWFYICQCWLQVCCSMYVQDICCLCRLLMFPLGPQVIEPIQSRCAIVRFTKVSDADVLARLQTVSRLQSCAAAAADLRS